MPCLSAEAAVLSCSAGGKVFAVVMKIVKKLLSLSLAAIIAVCVYVPAYAQDSETSGSLGENITYTYDSTTETLTVSGSGDIYAEDGKYPWKEFKSLKTVVVGEGITSLGKGAFNSLKKLRFIELPSTLKSIGASAISGTDLYELNIPEGVEKIDDYGCEYLENLRKLTLPKSLREVGKDAFFNDNMLAELIIPENLTTIGDGAFAGMSSVEKITVDSANPAYDSRGNCNAIIETETNTMIAGCANTTVPKTVTAIKKAFYDLSTIKEFTVPDWVTEIGDKTFWSCKNLEKIDLGSGLKKVGYDAFYNCDKLKSVVFPNSVTELGSMIFWDCDSLESVKLPSKIDYIPFGMFASCYSMTEFEIPSNIVRLEECALQSTGIRELVIPKNVLNISRAVIQNSPNLEKLTVDKDNPVYDSRGGCNAIIETKTNTLIAGCDVTVIPDTVETIGPDAFEGQRMRFLDVPDSVTLIDEYAFQSCKMLNTLVIPKTVKKVKGNILLWTDNFKRILYTGTEQEWQALMSTAGANNKTLKSANVIFNYDRNHTHTAGEVIEDPPTCTEKGQKTTYCSYCYQPYDTQPIAALGHIEDEPKTEVEPDCETEGEIVTRCMRCGEKLKSQSIPALGHIKGEPKTESHPGCEAEGEIVTRCTRCGEKLESEAIPALGHIFESGSQYCLRGCGTENPDYAPAKGEINDGTPADQVDKTVESLKNDDDVKGSVFRTLGAKQSKVTKTSIKISWNKVKGAKTYVVYGNKCGKTKAGKFNAYKKLKTVSKTSFTKKKLKKGTYYKYLVVAFDKNKKSLSTSKTLHIATTGGKVTNAKSVSVKSKTLTLKVGKSKTLKVTLKKENTKLRLKTHRNTAFESSKKKTASVSSKGKIKAKKKGTCYVYAYAQNGRYVKIRVVVK